MKKINVNVKWVISFVVTLIGFLFIEKVMTIQPEFVSGNGNLGIAFMFIILPFFILSFYLTYKQIRRLLLKLNTWIVNLIVLLLCVISVWLLTVTLVDFINELVRALGGPPTEENSRIYRYGWFNQYTNSFYFNIYTFLIAHIVAVAASSLISLFSIKK